MTCSSKQRASKLYLMEACLREMDMLSPAGTQGQRRGEPLPTAVIITTVDAQKVVTRATAWCLLSRSDSIVCLAILHCYKRLQPGAGGDLCPAPSPRAIPAEMRDHWTVNNRTQYHLPRTKSTWQFLELRPRMMVYLRMKNSNTSSPREPKSLAIPHCDKRGSTKLILICLVLLACGPVNSLGGQHRS